MTLDPPPAGGIAATIDAHMAYRIAQDQRHVSRAGRQGQQSNGGLFHSETTQGRRTVTAPGHRWPLDVLTLPRG